MLSDLDGCDVDDFIKAHSLIDVRDRLYDHLIQRDEDDKDILYDYLSDIPEELLSVIYYKNNLMEFIKDHEEITDLLLTIFESVKNLDYIDEDDDEWQLKVDSDLENEFYEVFKGKSAKDYNKFVDKQYFLDPNDPPVTVIHYLELLKDYVMKYVYVRYLAFDRIYRLKNFKRSTVTVIDTDSNILSLDTIVNYIFDEIIKSEKFGRSTRNNEFILVNTICYLLTGVVTDILLTYGEYSNIPEEFRPIFSMKNEFFFEILIIGEKKKRYISKIVLREGNLLKKPKSDVKGFDLKKASTAEAAEDFYMGLINKYIINADRIDVRGMIKELEQFKEDVYKSITNGEKTFLPNGNVKEIGAYKDPGRVTGVLASTAWNILNPDNMIEAPAKVSLVKLNIFNEESIEDLKDVDIEKYNLIIDKIFNDNTGLFVKKKVEPIGYIKEGTQNWWLTIPSKYRARYKEKGIKAWNEFVDEVYDKGLPREVVTTNKKGLQVIAIPADTDIPQWLMPYIDYSTIINNILSPFDAVLAIFKVRTVNEGKSVNSVNRKTKAISNIIKF